MKISVNYAATREQPIPAKRADLKAVGNFPESVIAQNSLLMKNWSSWCYSVNLPSECYAHVENQMNWLYDIAYMNVDGGCW